MNLDIIGICHFDPYGRNRLSDALEKLSSNNVNSPPAFVAVEWGEILFKQVEKQRFHFRKLLQEEFRLLSKKELDILELSLGYEADTHIEVFPSAEVLWLDEGRNADVSSYAKQRLKMYKYFLSLDLNEENLTENDVLRKLSIAAKHSSQSICEHTPRDAVFSKRIIKKILKAKAPWAIIIVGASHADGNLNSMRSLLEDSDQNVKCFVKYVI